MTLSPRQLSLVECEGWWTENSGETRDMKRIEGGKKAKAERKKHQKRSGRSTVRTESADWRRGGAAGATGRKPRLPLFPLFRLFLGGSSFCAAFPFLSTLSVGPQRASTSLSTTQHPPYLYSFDSLITAESIGNHHSVILWRFHYFLSNYQSFFATLLSPIRIKSKQQL